MSLRYSSSYSSQYSLGSPEINGNIYFLMNMYIHVCIIYACVMNCTQSPTVLITHGQPCARQVNIIYIIYVHKADRA